LVPAAAHVVGFQTWRYGAGAVEGAAYGAGGAEAAFDGYLRGDRSLSFRELVTNRLTDRPQNGSDVSLTIDAELQREAAGLLGEREGAVVVVDIATGAVRALVSSPSFDPAGLDSGAELPESLLVNRATHGLYPPGSIWKTVTLAGALSRNLAQPGTRFADGDAVEYFDGFPVRCDNNPEEVGEFDLVHAYAWSCNVTFARLASRLGAADYRDLAAAFGAGSEPPFVLGAAAGSVSTDADIGPAELASAGFGQGELLVTPLQMALVAAAVAGDGSMPVPELVESAGGAGPPRRRTWLDSIDSGTARRIRDIMIVSVEEGWASAAISGLNLSAGGKTGTAQVADGQPHAWFIGFAPADEPRFAIAVLVAHGGEGSRVAAPIAGRVLELALEREEHSK
jgi:peptidoglycan glycosyltransferase